MSQSGITRVSQGILPPTVPTSFVTNSGTAVPAANILDILGAVIAADSFPFRTIGSGNTVTINIQTSQAIAATDSTKIGLAAFNSAEFTVDANGFVSLVGSAAPAIQTINSIGPNASGNFSLIAGTGITLTPGVNSETISINGSVVGETITGNSGGALSPSAGNWNILGTGSITASGSVSTLTVQLTGLTANSVLYGQGTATIGLLASGTTGQVLQTNTGAAPTYSTATYPSTTTINQILYSSAANTVSGLATANNGVLTTGATGVPVITALSANGQIIIGSGSGAPIAATLTPGSGITITNASNSITIAQTNPSGFPWTDVTSATQTLAVNNGYITDHSATVVYTLPASAAIGDTMIIMGKLGLATITPNANQQILIGSASGAVGVTGTAVSNNVGDCITLICITSGASTVWRAKSVIGTWTLN